MTTPVFGFPFPAPGTPPDGATQVRALAEAVEGQLQTTDAAVTGVGEDLAELDALGPKVLGTFDGGDGTNVTTLFNNIDQSYRMLQLQWRGRHDGTNNGVSLGLRFNGDGTSGNYASFRGFAIPGAADWSIDELQVLTAIHAGMVGSNFGSHGVLWIPVYSLAAGGHAVHGTSFARGVSDSATGIMWSMGGGFWTAPSTTSVTSIQLWPVGRNWNGNVLATLTGYS